MAILYKSYCYPTIYDVNDQLTSNMTLDGLGYIYNTYVHPPSSINVIYMPFPTSDKPLIYSNPKQLYSFSFPSCQKIGYASSFSGLDQKDSILIAESVVAVLILAWTFKILSRSL